MCKETKEQNTTEKPRGNCDARTFMIALLTAVIVVAVYHFGMGFARIFCPPDYDSYSCRPAPRYMLVPVMEMEHSPCRSCDAPHGKRVAPWKKGMKRPPAQMNAKKQPPAAKTAKPAKPGKPAPAPKSAE